MDIVRQNVVGDRIDHRTVELVLNDREADGWRLQMCVETEVASRVGPGGSNGLKRFYERPGPAAP
ncbi:MAG: DUF4177 domain-containing protein [Thermoleophilia bacterium]